MESALSSLILFTVGLFAAVTLSHTYLETQDLLWTAEQARQEERLERERTDLEIIQAETQDSGSTIAVKVRNSGQVKLADFERWDLIVQYYSKPNDRDYLMSWLPYSEGPLDNMQWTVSGIYLDANETIQEVFEPGILNPDEEMIIQIKVLPPIPVGSTNLLTISTHNGITVSSHFTR